MKFATRVSWRNTSEKVKVTSKAANEIDSDSYEVVEANFASLVFLLRLKNSTHAPFDLLLLSAKAFK